MRGRPAITKEAATDLKLGESGSYSNVGNALQHTLFDSYLIGNATAATVLYFTQPIGAAYGAGGVKSIIETNLQSPGQLPNGQTMLVKEMSVALKLNMTNYSVGTNNAIDDLINAYYTMQENSTWEIEIAGRSYDFQIPGSEFIPTIHGVGIASTNIGPIRAVGDVIMSGWSKIRATPIMIAQLVTFKVIQRCASVNAAAQLTAAFAKLNNQEAEIQVRLRGLLTRSI